MGVGVGVDEMQNKAEAQPAWLQLAAGAKLSLAILFTTKKLKGLVDEIQIKACSSWLPTS